MLRFPKVSKSFWFVLLLLQLLNLAEVPSQRQSVIAPPPVFTHADTLRGMLTPERTCYDVKYYDLAVKIDPATRFLSGSNTIHFFVDSAFDRMQIDLFANMRFDTITLDDNPASLSYVRDSNAAFVKFPQKLEKGTMHRVRIAYSGNPIVAKNPPWQGGFTWTDDSLGNPWVVVTCQGTGASLWWPNKDHQSDEPDSMSISVTVPKGLIDVSNGRLRRTTELAEGWTRYDWFVSYPINNYDVTVNIGKYDHFADTYMSGADTYPNGGKPLTLDYYVLPQHVERAHRQFEQVKGMLKAFEKYFGPYPFIRDGYKLIECPHNGMEHQSAVAYGNKFLEGYKGGASSAVGLKFDFIIVHESAHEWWGNSVTSKDIADMWIHESFGAYAEALFVEEVFGRQEALKYINAKKQNIRNNSPIIGVYNVQHEGSGDMYDKGQLVLNTLRSVIDEDKLWFSMLRGLQETYRYQTITTDTLVAYVDRRTGKDYSYFFDQYLKYSAIPRLDFIVRQKGEKVAVRYRWVADVTDFRMPIKVTTSRGKFDFIYPTSNWQTMELHNINPEEVQVAENLFYVEVRLIRTYVDPSLGD